MENSISTWIIILGIIFISGIVKGTTGFGFSLFSLPLLVHFIPIKNLVSLLTIFNLFTSILIIIQTRDFHIKRSVILLSVTGSFGVILGTFLLKYLPDLWLKLFASIVFIVLSFIFLSGYRFKIRKIRRGNTLAGLISGLLGGSLSLGGPSLALFLTSLHIDSKSFRYTFAWFSIFTASIAVVSYIKIGFINQTSIIIFLVSVPLLLLSVWLGKLLIGITTLTTYYKGVIIITLFSGILLFYTSLNKFVHIDVTIKSISEILSLSGIKRI